MKGFYRILGAFVGACLGFMLLCGLVMLAAVLDLSGLGPLAGVAALLIIGGAVLGWIAIADRQEG